MFFNVNVSREDMSNVKESSSSLMLGPCLNNRIIPSVRPSTDASSTDPVRSRLTERKPKFSEAFLRRKAVLLRHPIQVHAKLAFLQPALPLFPDGNERQ